MIADLIIITCAFIMVFVTSKRSLKFFTETVELREELRKVEFERDALKALLILAKSPQQTKLLVGSTDFMGGSKIGYGQKFALKIESFLIEKK